LCLFTLFTGNDFYNKSFDMGRITKDDRCLNSDISSSVCFAR